MGSVVVLREESLVEEVFGELPQKQLGEGKVAQLLQCVPPVKITRTKKNSVVYFRYTLYSYAESDSVEGAFWKPMWRPYEKMMTDDEFVVEKILSEKRERGVRLFETKWVDWDETSWEPKECFVSETGEVNNVFLEWEQSKREINYENFTLLYWVAMFSLSFFNAGSFFTTPRFASFTNDSGLM